MSGHSRFIVTRSAIFVGQIKPGQEQAFFEAVDTNLVPAWQQMLHAIEVRIFRPLEAEPAGKGVFLIQEIDYPSRDHIAEALASPRRNMAMQALEAVKPLYEGAHHHIISERRL